MAKTWVLDTETKGTGATMVPLEKVLEQPRREERILRIPRRRDAEPGGEPEAPRPREPYRFRVMDVMTRRILAKDVGARETVDALADVRSVVDVAIDVWEPDTEAWRRLTLDERKLLWKHRVPSPSGSPSAE
jgi:hypothetical protein